MQGPEKSRAGISRRSVLASSVAAMMLLPRCATISTTELDALGAGITPTTVDFPRLYEHAERAKMAYASEDEIRAAYPQTILIDSPGNTDVVYFLEVDDKEKIQRITVRGTSNIENVWEDIEIGEEEDPAAGIPLDAGKPTEYRCKERAMNTSHRLHRPLQLPKSRRAAANRGFRRFRAGVNRGNPELKTGSGHRSVTRSAVAGG